MRYIKIIIGLGLIPLGVFAGSYVIFDGGNGAFLGGILGGILCCLLFWSVPSLDEQHRIINNVDKEALDKAARSFREAKMEEQTLYRALTRRH